MPSDLAARLDAFAARLPHAYPGPGGAVAVVRGGEVLLRHAWGYANAERRVPFTPATLFRICSITKQFACAALLDAVPDPSSLDAALRARLPLLQGPAPSVLHLCHNQSGLRDYWAVAMLHGSPAEAPFGKREAAQVIGGTRSLHFAPGARYSYANQNFRLVSDLLEERTGRSFAELLRERVFARAGMGSAMLAADTRALPDGTEGYEGAQGTGFRAAENRILWTGDAGIAASLDDLIAWERWADATRDDAGSLHQRLSAPVAFADGAVASYGFGLARGREFGREVTGHGGALRGWRSHRLRVAAERLSVVVLFNHMADAQAAAVEALRAALGEAATRPDAGLPAPEWLGRYAEPETGLALAVEAAGPGQVLLRYAQGPERLDLQPDGSATNGRTALRPTAEGLWMHRPQDNHRSLLRPQGEDGPTRGLAGRYRCSELGGAELEVAEAGAGALYGGFGGFLGLSRMELLEPAGPDLWLLPCFRALDHAPPGRWTLAFRRDGDGRAGSVEVGCWLARGLRYDRAG